MGWLAYRWKAISAGVTAALGSVGAGLADGKITVTEALIALGAAIVAYTAAYNLENGPKPTQ